MMDRRSGGFSWLGKDIEEEGYKVVVACNVVAPSEIDGFGGLKEGDETAAVFRRA